MVRGRDGEKKERERENERTGETRALLWKTTCTGNAVANGVNGRSLRRNTVRQKRGRKNKRLPQQMDGGGRDMREKRNEGRMGKRDVGRKKRERKRGYLYYSKKGDR